MAQNGLDHEIDQLLLLMEEVLKIALRIKEETNKQSKTLVGEINNDPQTKNQLNKTPEAETTKDVSNQIMEQLDEKMKTFTGLQRDIAHKIQQPEKSLIQESEEAFFLSPALEEERDQILKAINQLESQIEGMKQELKTVDPQNASALSRLGNRLVQLDEKIKDLSNQITAFFSAIPERAKANMAMFFISKLDRVAEKIDGLKMHLSEVIDQKLENEQTEPVKKLATKEKQETVIKKEVAIKPEINKDEKTTINKINEKVEVDIEKKTEFMTAKVLLETEKNKGHDFFTIKSLLSSMHGQVKEMEGDVQNLQVKIIEQAKNIGIQTEIDPKVGVYERMYGNEKEGIKTVASVNEEIEDLTLTDYSPNMEKAYQAGFDVDPNVATEPTKEEWRAWEMEQ